MVETTISEEVTKWAEKVDSGSEYRNHHLFAMQRMIEATHGPHYQRRGNHRFFPENTYYSYLTLMLPRLIFDNPKMKVETRRPGTQMQTAEAIRHGLNRWCRDNEYRALGVRLATDFLYNYGVAMVVQAPVREQKTDELWMWDEDGTWRIEEDSVWPSVYRIPQDRFVIDPQSFHPTEARWMGHRWDRDLSTLEKEAKAHPDEGWDLDAIEKLYKQGRDSQSTYGDALGLYDDRPESPKDPKVTCYTIWVPDMELPESDGPEAGFHGTLLTLGHIADAHDSRSSAVWLREPRPYYGPDRGPYVIFGAYYLPGKLFPLSPLVAIEGQIRELNRHAMAWSRSAERGKNVILYNEKDTKTAAKLRRAEHDFFVGIPGFDKTKFAEAQIGGAKQFQYESIQYLQERLARVSSMDEAQMGQVTGGATATENTIADESSTTRLAFLKQQYTDRTAEVMSRVAWFMYHDDEVRFPLGEEAADDMQMAEPWFHGGDPDEESDASFKDLELEIEPFSMERTDEAGQLQRTMSMAQFVIETAPMIPEMPWVKWDEIYEMVGTAMNMPLAADLVDIEAAYTAQPFQAGSRPAQPRLGRDVGGGGQSSRPSVAGPRGPQKMIGAGAGPAGAEPGARNKGQMGAAATFGGGR